MTGVRDPGRNSQVNLQIDYHAPDVISRAVADIGRTEDIKFSPDGRRLAIAGFSRGLLLVIDLDWQAGVPGKRLLLTGHAHISSDCLHQPHGIAFIDNSTMIVANRGGEIAILQLPAGNNRRNHYHLAPISKIGTSKDCPVQTPGSVAVSQLDDNHYEVLVCNNYIHCVTRHIIDVDADYRVISNRLFLHKRLGVPDGIAISGDRRWVAVSNHNKHCVMLYDNDGTLGPHSEPTAVLRDISYPHGLLFSADGDMLLAADAGSRYVRGYRATDSSWKGIHRPDMSLCVMDEPTFCRGNFNVEEGGPKGIDLDKQNQVLAVTSEHMPLAFFDLSTILQVGNLAGVGSVRPQP